MDEDSEEQVSCPYCESTDQCVHLLLLVDVTFRTPSGGVLYEAFGDRWAQIGESDGEATDIDESEQLAELLEEVDSLADWDTEYEFEGGPGMSSTYRIFFVSSADKARAAQAQFSGKGEL